MIKLIIFFFLFTSCINSEVTFKQEEDKQSKKLYSKQCAMCHGELGLGDGFLSSIVYPKPRDFSSPTTKWINGKSINGITRTLTTEPHSLYYSNSRLVDVYFKDTKRLKPEEELFLLAEYTFFIATMSEIIMNGLNKP